MGGYSRKSNASIDELFINTETIKGVARGHKIDWENVRIIS